jgi:hypothetical protein
VKLTASSGGLNADVVPAAALGDFGKDPIAIYSRGRREERKNYPRTHYDNGVAKQRATNNAYKATVRLFKRWAKQYDGFDKIAPSFYIECAVHHVETGKFDAYLPLSFATVGAEICSWTRHKVIRSVAGDKDILVPDEWRPDNFEKFKAKLVRDLALVLRALQATTTQEADRLWKLAFGE